MTATAALMKYLRTAVPMWTGTIFVVAGGFTSMASLGDWRDARRFAHDAVTSEARVVAKSHENTTRNGKPTTRYLVTYRFAAAGQEHEQTEEIPIEEWEKVAEGHTAVVRFLPEEPRTARTREPPVWEPPLLSLFTTLFVLLGAGLAWPGWRRAFVLIRLHREGVAARATVLAVAPTSFRIKRVMQWRVRYEFHDDRGLAQTGTSDNLSPSEAAHWRVGDHGAIRYNRLRPRESVWIGNT